MLTVRQEQNKGISKILEAPKVSPPPPEAGGEINRQCGVASLDLSAPLRPSPFKYIHLA